MSFFRYFTRALLSCALVLPLVLQAEDDTESAKERALDLLVMHNGSKILGRVISAEDGVIVVETDFAGTLKIDHSTVASITTDGSLVLQLADGVVIRDQPIVMEDERISVVLPTGEQHSYAVADVIRVNPEPWELGEGYKSFGSIGFAWVLQRGNTDTDELDYKLESFWRSLRDRYTLLANGEQDESSGVKSANNWTLTGKYDYFLGETDYWGLKLSAEEDEFRDLNMRTYAGPYYGRQFSDTPLLALQADLGMSYVVEDFIIAPDDEYLGATWDLRVNSNYLGGESQLYLTHVGIWDLDQTENVILNTTIGLSFPLLGSLEAAAEVLLEYDSGAVEGVEELDQTYRFRIGYLW